MVLSGDRTLLDEDLQSAGIDLSRLLIVSQVRCEESAGAAAPLQIEAYTGLGVEVQSYEAHTCARCWRRVDAPVADEKLPDLCERCHDVVSRLLAEGRVEIEAPGSA